MRKSPLSLARLDRGFTLIELLIVVAIIAILAAIAVPNFLEAQVRSKRSRVLSDLRTMRTAAEAYAVDYNRHPRHTNGIGNYPGIGNFYDEYLGEPIFGCMPKEVTTPVAYITTLPLDPFVANTSGSSDAKLYTYHHMDTYRRFFELGVSIPVPNMPGWIYVVPNANSIRRYENYFGKYVLLSVGPLGDAQLSFNFQGGATPFWMQYDPTNGSVSRGTIFVSQKSTEPVYVDWTVL